jgi:thiosulfate dehydrogenase
MRRQIPMKPKAALMAIAGALLLAMTSGWTLGTSPAAAFEGPAADAELGPTFLLSIGGKLYDDLWAILDKEPPPGRNPALPGRRPAEARETWRCVTCHGWDYSGADIGGRRIPGLRDLADADPEAIASKIRDPSHPFPVAELPDLAVDLLAFFLSQGQYDGRDFFGRDGEALGEAEFGRAIFEGACISCHEIDGRRFLQGERGDRSSLGWIVRNRPEQALHKILNGVPAAEMLSLRFLSNAQIADLLAYLQTLDPAER